MRARCHLRVHRGKRTLSTLSESSGVIVSELSRIERGEVLPRDKNIEAMEEAYGVPLAEWYEWRGPFLVIDMEGAGS